MLQEESFAFGEAIPAPPQFNRKHGFDIVGTRAQCDCGVFFENRDDRILFHRVAQHISAFRPWKQLTEVSDN